MYMKESVKLFDMMTGKPTPRVVEVEFFKVISIVYVPLTLILNSECFKEAIAQTAKLENIFKYFFLSLSLPVSLNRLSLVTVRVYFRKTNLKIPGYDFELRYS